MVINSDGLLQKNEPVQLNMKCKYVEPFAGGQDDVENNLSISAHQIKLI